MAALASGIRNQSSLLDGIMIYLAILACFIAIGLFPAILFRIAFKPDNSEAEIRRQYAEDFVTRMENGK